MDTLSRLTDKLGSGRVVENKNLSPYFTMKLETAAQYYFEAETADEIVLSYLTAKELGIPYFLLGGGSNIAVLKSVIPGLVVRNMYQKKELLSEDDDSAELLVSSGYSTTRLARETAEEGLEGLEFHLGLPGTVGGGVAMNSKWAAPMGYPGSFPKYMGDPLLWARIMRTDGTVHKAEHDYFRFAYDYSVIKDTGEIILDCVFKLKKGNVEELVKRGKDAMEYRRKTQVVGQPTCGCMFQNISDALQLEKQLPTKSAGYLVDQCGWKNRGVGDFVVSEKHANFIINQGKGKPEDLTKLITEIKQSVKEKFGVELEEEVVLL